MKISSFFVPKSNALDTGDISSVQFKSMQVKLESNQTSTRALDIADQKRPTLLAEMLKQCLSSSVMLVEVENNETSNAGFRHWW